MINEYTNNLKFLLYIFIKITYNLSTNSVIGNRFLSTNSSLTCSSVNSSGVAAYPTAIKVTGISFSESKLKCSIVFLISKPAI